MAALQQATYSSSIFNVADTKSARHIILTDEEGLTSDARWATETPYLVSLIELTMPLKAGAVVLDYGCGIGRMAKALIDKFNCFVVGVDISPNMRALAAAYVASDKFLVCAPEGLSALGVRCDAGLAIWVLQHCREPGEDLLKISGALKSQAPLFVLNEKYRCVPTREHGWVDDKQDIFAMLESWEFNKSHIDIPLDALRVGGRIAQQSVARIYKRSLVLLPDGSA